MVRESFAGAGSSRRASHRRESLLFAGDDENEAEVVITKDEFINFCKEMPDWLHEKMMPFMNQYEDTLDHAANLAEEQVQAQTTNANLAIMQKELDEMKEKLRQAQRDRDVYANKIAQMAVGNTGAQTGGSGAPVAC